MVLLLHAIEKMTEALGARIGNLEDTVSAQAEEISELQDQLRLERDTSRSLSLQVDELVNRSMRENLVFSGVAQEDDTESPEVSERKIQEVLAKIDVTGVVIDRAHRAFRRPQGSTRAVNIIARIPSTKDRDKISQNRRKLAGSNIYINEQFSKRVNEARFHLRKLQREARGNGKRTIMNMDKLRIENKTYMFDHERGEVYDVSPTTSPRNTSHGRGPHQNANPAGVSGASNPS
jgi:uncharacterized coiled-coil protein SlyX